MAIPNMTGCSVPAEEPFKGTSILFLGNSLTFWEDMPLMLKEIAESKGHDVQVDYQLCQGGGALQKQAESAGFKKTLEKRKWDYVVLQEQSELPYRQKEEFHSSVRYASRLISASGHSPTLYIPNIRHDRSVIENLVETIASYEEIADELQVGIVPAAVAWLELLNTQTEIALYSEDRLHPSRLGAYLTASVFYATLFADDPCGATTDMLEGKDMQEQALLLQEVAWNVVSDYRKGISR